MRPFILSLKFNILPSAGLDDMYARYLSSVVVLPSLYEIRFDQNERGICETENAETRILGARTR